MAMTSDFPSLIPAFTIYLYQTVPLALGPSEISPGAISIVGPISTGTITSEPGFVHEILNGTFVYGADVIRVAPMEKAATLDFSSVIMMSETENIYFSFTGYVEANNETLPYLTDYANSTGYDFGSAFVSALFETEWENYTFLTDKVFVGSQRIVKEADNGFAAEIKLSQVGL